MENLFTEIYNRNIWGSSETRSGNGSTLVQTKTIREKIPELIKKYNIQSVLDAPCGDYNWMKEVKLNCSYIGVDIVPEIVNSNIQKYGNKFICLDITRDPLPKADLIITRDCFQHLSYEFIQRAINNMKKSGARYLLLSTYIDWENNTDMDLHLLGFRLLNFSKPPFNFKHIDIIHEESTEDERSKYKSLALYSLSDIPDEFI